MTSTATEKPLSGLRCLTLAQNLPGPAAVQLLVQDGMSVRKIEPPQGDMARTALAGWYEELCEGIQVDTVDLRSKEGQADLMQALKEVDLLVTSQRRSALARLGITADAIADHAPDLCWVEIVGDADAPDIPGHDLTYQAEVGLLSPPFMPTTLIADLGGAQQAAFAATTLLLGRARGAAQRHTVVGLKQAAAFFAAPLRHKVTAKGGLLSGVLPQYKIHETKDGWAAMGALEPHFTASMSEHFGADPADTLADMTNEDINTLAKEHDIPVKTFRT